MVFEFEAILESQILMNVLAKIMVCELEAILESSILVKVLSKIMDF